MSNTNTPGLDLPLWFTQRVESRLTRLYGAHDIDLLMDKLISCIRYCMDELGKTKDEHWNQEDVILISYGDSIRQPDEKPLQTLYEFLKLHLQDSINCVHILPYFPFSSDDGFAVIDYKMIDPLLGDWHDIERISQDFSLMTDLVINHVSRENLWFVDFISDVAPGRNYFIEMPEHTDVSSVVRPRSTPLLIPAHTHQGVRHVWATFGEDQIDVNFENPEVLFEFIEILLLYINKGSRFIRLDAIAFLWKKLGTRCINLRETHEVVKLLRDVVDIAAPGTVIITETNVPNGENLSYFGNSDEAHMVYQFTLPPLLLHALFFGDSSYLTRWSMDMPRPQNNCTYLNFIASHDGIGLRPAEGILPMTEVLNLVESMHQYGGYVSMRTDANGNESPYEINIALFDALRGTQDGVDSWQVQRFLCAHSIMLALQGIPAIYIHSMTATPNDVYGVEQTGRTRSINRHKWDYDSLMTLLNNEDSPNAKIFYEMKQLLKVRQRHSAFHPDADQETLMVSDDLFVFRRSSAETSQTILCVNNITHHNQQFTLPDFPVTSGSGIWRELKSNAIIQNLNGKISLDPYQCLWLEAMM